MNGGQLNLPMIVLGLVIAGLILGGAVLMLSGFVRILARCFAHVGRFIGGEIGDGLRLVGAGITAMFFTPLIVGNVVIGRWSAASHYGNRFKDEVRAGGHAFYRMVIGHPARLFFLTPLVEGWEKRLPQAMAEAPGSDRPSAKTGQFSGYTIVGSLPSGGSGGRLYIADPSAQKMAAFARAGLSDRLGNGQVVIKSFSLADGSTMPQIVRESRALEAARKLGLVLDHELSDARFYYVMPYVPGESLTLITRKLHAQAGGEGLGYEQLKHAMNYIADLLTALEFYHRGGLWHKDVKPDNIIVSSGRAHVVDLGLVTPLRSGMTLTTHGTEYFRDPELVRMALRGAKVHEVDGVKFDVYGAGAVLYSVVENSFPAHGGLSQITKRCPEALRWVIRRAMAEMHQRYPTAEAMLVDLRAILAAGDPFALKPVDLPSMKEGGAAVFAAASYAPPPIDPQGAKLHPAGYVESPSRAGMPIANKRPMGGRSADEQLKSARARVQAAQQRVGRRRGKRYSNKPNAGVAMGLGLVMLLGGGALIGAWSLRTGKPMPGFEGRRGNDAVVSADPAKVLKVSFETDGGVKSEFQAWSSFDRVPGIEETEASGIQRHIEALLATQHDRALQGDVLLVSFLPTGAEPENEKKLRYVLGRLATNGWGVTGVGDTEEDLKYVAEAKTLIGLREVGDAGARAEVRNWLDLTKRFDAVLWVPRGGESWWLIRGAEFEEAEARKLLSLMTSSPMMKAPAAPSVPQVPGSPAAMKRHEGGERRVARRSGARHFRLELRDLCSC